MKSTMNEFISRVKTYGLPTSTHFFVFIPNVGDQDMMMMCDSANLPGLSHMTNDIRTFGEITEVPYGVLYQPLQMSFILDSTMVVKGALDNWMNEVFNRDSRSIGYYDDYTRDISVYVTDRAGNVIYTQIMREAYPKSIGDIQMDYSNESILRVQVQLAYKWWEIDTSAIDGNSNVNIIKNLGSNNNSILDSYKNSYNNFNSLFGVNPESQGVVTGVGNSGPNYYESNSGNINSLSGIFENDAYNIGIQAENDFYRASNATYAALNTSLVDPNLAEQIIYATKSAARDMAKYSSGLKILSGDTVNVSTSASVMSDSMYDLSQTLTGLDNAMAQYGYGNPFSSTIPRVSTAGVNMASVTNLSQMPGGLTNIGAGLSIAGVAMNSLLGQLNGTETGFNTSVDRAIRMVSNSFLDNGTNTQNLAALLAARIQ